MRKFFSILFLMVLLTAISFAQERAMTGSTPPTMQGNEPGTQPVVTVKSEIKSFTLENQFSYQKSVPVDTSTNEFHIYSPMFRKGISNTYLGYLGSPYISNNFFDRINYSNYYFHSNMDAYLRSQRDVKYYNTTTPFALLKYNEASGEAEQVFRAFLTQNIDSITNFGFDFNAVKGEGQYKNQLGIHRNLNFFFSRNTGRYNAYASVITSTDSLTENGGLKDSSINTSTNPSFLPIKLSGLIGSNIKTFSAFASFEYLLGEIPFLKNEAKSDSTFLARYGIQYSAEFNNYKRNFTEKVVDANFFDTIYFNNDAGRIDSSSFKQFTHTLQLKVFENPLRKFTFGKRAFLENEVVSATHPVYNGQREYKYSNMYVGGEIYNRQSHFMQWSAYGRFALLGRNLGDAIVKGTLIKPLRIFNDTISIVAEGWYKDISPDIFQEHWYNNHFKWENKFTKQHEVVLKARIDWDRNKLHTGVNYVMMSNFIYNDYSALPAQYNGEFSVFSAWFNKEFMIGPIRWNNKIIVQQATNNSVVHLPFLNAFFSLSVNGTLFKVLKYQVGTELYYNSRFYADKYEPSTTRFYLQDNMLTGGYPLLNAFVNAKLKRTSFFARLSHFNSSFSGGNFFSSPFYPHNQMAFQFGALWSFYD